MADILGKIHKYVVRVCNFLRTFRVNLFDGMPQTGRRAGGDIAVTESYSYFCIRP